MVEIRRVMLVDDEPDIRTIAEMSLTAVGGWAVTTAASGQEALLLVSDEKPDLILLDVMMPELDGPSTLRALRDSPRGRDVPVIFMTAKAQPREVESYLALGARGVVVKPFDPMNLPDQVRAILAASPQDDPRADVGSPA